MSVEKNVYVYLTECPLNSTFVCSHKCLKKLKDKKFNCCLVHVGPRV